MAALEITPELDQRLLDARADRLALRPAFTTEAARALDPLLVFLLNGERFCLRMSAVSGVVPLANLITVPGAHSAIEGVMAIKGEVHAIFALGRVLNLPVATSTDPSAGPAGYVMVLRLGGGVHFGIAVDQVEAIDHADLTDTTDTSHDLGAGRRLITLPSGRDLILIEDFERLLAPFIQGVAP